MKLFDLHCDTATELLKKDQELYENCLHVSLSKAETFENYAQVCAVWSDSSLSDWQAWSRFFEVLENFQKEVEKNKNRASIISRSKQIPLLWEKKKAAFIISVEDARILENEILRLDVLRRAGVRILTLNWSGVSCIGGAHDTDVGLTDFGIKAVKKCFDIGIIPDVSHSSEAGTKECIRLAHEKKKPIIASHSDSYSVNPHSRNLRDEDFCDIAKLGGLVGICLCKNHLSDTGHATVSDVIRHIEHFLSLNGENTICLGCDMDGTDMPDGIENISDLSKIANELSRLNYSNNLIEKIFYGNALEFAKNNI